MGGARGNFRHAPWSGNFLGQSHFKRPSWQATRGLCTNGLVEGKTNLTKRRCFCRAPASSCRRLVVILLSSRRRLVIVSSSSHRHLVVVLSSSHHCLVVILLSSLRCHRHRPCRPRPLPRPPPLLPLPSLTCHSCCCCRCLAALALFVAHHPHHLLHHPHPRLFVARYPIHRRHRPHRCRLFPCCCRSPATLLSCERF